MTTNEDLKLPPPIDWADFRERAWHHLPTSVLVRHVARAELLIAADPVRARSAGERAFRAALVDLYEALNDRLPRGE